MSGVTIGDKFERQQKAHTTTANKYECEKARIDQLSGQTSSRELLAQSQRRSHPECDERKWAQQLNN